MFSLNPFLRTFLLLATIANGVTEEYDLTEPVVIRWKDRRTVLPAVVIPTAKDILLGAMPLEGMDLYVDPVNKRLAGVHGDSPVYVTY